jgi:hypothetical protein
MIARSGWLFHNKLIQLNDLGFTIGLSYHAEQHGQPGVDVQELRPVEGGQRARGSTNGNKKAGAWGGASRHADQYRVRAPDARFRQMRDLRKIAQSSQPHNSTIMDPINEAIEEINSLGPGETFTYTGIAKKYGVVRSTLTRRHKGETASATTQYANNKS